jgi:UDP-N-acetylglucosamine--N-acetylmuramyl-(pentapeptide) pyrophosphoryl-undecaprenol N-acetylglucosamine transferase
LQQHNPYRILISGGGTGGHIFPAIAIANALKARDPRTEFLFVGAEGRMEMQKVPEAGYTIEGLNITGFQRGNLLKNFSLPFKIASSLMKANSIINNFKPDVVVGVGGFASGPVMWVGAKKGVPVLVQEQNQFAGMTNKLVANKADKFCVAYEGMERFFPKDKIVITGNPVRAEILNRNVTREEAISHFNLDANKKTILIIGGSLGARAINNAIKKDIELLQNSGHQVLWQTGKIYFEEMKAAAQGYADVHAMEFIKRMDLAYEVADVIISRAGAISISELCLVGKPVILLPSPNVTEDHQTYNAQALVDKSAALMIKDAVANQELVPAVLALLNDNAQQQLLAENIKKLGIANATERIADEVIKLIKK